jgi:hypothetical protein
MLLYICMQIYSVYPINMNKNYKNFHQENPLRLDSFSNWSWKETSFLYRLLISVMLNLYVSRRKLQITRKWYVFRKIYLYTSDKISTFSTIKHLTKHFRSLTLFSHNNSKKNWISIQFVRTLYYHLSLVKSHVSLKIY